MEPELTKQLEKAAMDLYGCTLPQASKRQVYGVVCTTVRKLLQERQRVFSQLLMQQEKKQVYYLSMEFLVGKNLKNDLFQLGLTEAMEQALSQTGTCLEELADMEPDPGLGNGGLGRLAACYLDAMANRGYGATGFSILYEFGIFRQKIIDGWQLEFPDDWLSLGEVWLQPRKDETVPVLFGGRTRHFLQDGKFRTVQEDCETVLAVPCDLYIPGYGAEAVNKLTLWSATVPSGLDMEAFSRGDYLHALEKNTQAEVISKVLYPADDHPSGKRLRLRQQYLLVSASLQSIVSRHLRQYQTLDTLPDKAAIHINDTHPALCVPELMRLLVDENGYDWEKAWSIAQRTLSYTNHTVMQEALERWPVDLFSGLLPRIYEIVQEIDLRLRRQLERQYGGDAKKISSMAVLHGGEVQMANLCLACCHKINGVSQLHTKIITQGIFRDYWALDPRRFVNVTNGITYRRWLCQANPALTAFLQQLIGDGFYRDAQALEQLTAYENDDQVLKKLGEIKHENKKRLADYILKANAAAVDPSSIFDVQIKRLHEYKRQLLNILHVLMLYCELKQNPQKACRPRTFIFAAKASAGYAIAKQIISLIVTAGAFIAADPQVRDLIKVVFLEDYKVSLAELIIPAAEISEQISVAGKEASGTGNMKLMLNGAVTLGTLDGANVEILQAVGRDNMFLFGMNQEQVRDLQKAGYDPNRFLTPELAAVIQLLRSGILGRKFDDLADSLLTGRFGPADPYMTIADFEAYRQAQRTAAGVYEDRQKFLQMSLQNIAHAGRFSADRAVGQYGRMIWGLET